MPRPITIDEVVSFPYAGVGECDLSPDGKRVAYTHQSTIYIFDLEKWNLLGSFEGIRPKWSPTDPDVLAFLKPNTFGVFIRRIDGTERQLGENTGEVRNVKWSRDASTFEWSFDGRFLALVFHRDLEVQDVDNNGDAGDIVIVHPPSGAYASAIVVLHVETNKITFQAESDAGESYRHLAWHPSGDRLTVVSAIESQNQSIDWCLFDIDLRKGKRKSRIGPGKNEILRPKWSPDGKKLALGYSPYNYIHPVRNLCAVMEADSTQVRILNEEYFIDAVHWGGDGRKIFCSGLKGISRYVFCIDTVSGSSEVVVEQTGLTYLRGVSQDGQKLLTVFRGLKSLPDAYVIYLDSGRSRAVTQFSDQLADYELSDAEVVEWPSYDGFVLQGTVVPPLGKSMSPEYPTIVNLHGGPTEGGGAIFDRSWHWFAAQGFQVFAPDFRGSQQYQWCEPPTQEMDYKDVMSGIDWLASQQMCDKTKMGVYGFSYGAILGAYAIGKSTLFRCALLLNGAYDFRLSCGLGFNMRWNSILAQEMGGAPWEVPHIYQELSPISYVSKVETPVLIAHGEDDIPYEAELYTLYLRALGKEVEYVLYKGAGHTLSKSSHKKDYWERALNWFRKYLCE